MATTQTTNGRGRVQFRLPPDTSAQVSVAQLLAAESETGRPSWRTPPDVTAPVAVAQAATTAAPVWRAPADVQPTSAVSVAASAVTLEWSDDIGPAPSGAQPAPAEVPRPLDNQAIYRLVREVAVPLSGEDLYGATAADEQLGLLYGFVLFPQASAHLGSLLRLMRSRAEAAFRDVFGAAADELLTVTGTSDASARLAPVHGRLLWQEPWLSRFRQAGGVPAFQAAQNEEAIEHQFRPLLETALALGLTTERSLALAYDAVATRGVGGGVRWIVDSAGPLRTEQQRLHALAVLGFDGVAAFQATVGWVPKDGVFGPETHAALVDALRRQGDVPMPGPAELSCRLIGAAVGDARVRLERLAESDLLSDVAVTA